MASYIKAILIPFEQFERLKNDSSPGESGALAPPDIQLHQLRQQRLNDQYKKQQLQREVSTSGVAVTPPIKNNNSNEIDVIASSIPEKWRPYARSILVRMLAQPDLVSWRPNYEIVLNNQPISGSNIVELLQFLLKQKVVTRETDIPIASRDFYESLLQIVVPKSWIRVFFWKVGGPDELPSALDGWTTTRLKLINGRVLYNFTLECKKSLCGEQDQPFYNASREVD